MGKTSIIILIILSVMLSSCSQGDSVQQGNSSLSQFLNELTDSSEASAAQTPDAINYENILANVLGSSYLEGKAIMRVDDEQIFSMNCAVFQLGVHTDEHFIVEEWFAVSESSQVFTYDVALNEWFEYTVSTTKTPEQMQNCLYALNEIYTDEYSTEYYDTDDMIKKAVYESEEAFNNYEAPIMLIGLNEPVPDGYFPDLTEVLYMPVYNFNSKAQLYEHFSLYFTQQYIGEIKERVERAFFELDGSLYLMRGGMGYGMFNLDLDFVDYTNTIDNMLIVDILYFGEPDGNMLVKFKQESGSLKIDSVNFILMYDLYYANPDWQHIKVPDFQAFVSENTLPTPPDYFAKSNITQDTYIATYIGDYHDYLPEYVNMLKMLGFEVKLDGYEGFYIMEKPIEGYLLTVNAYFLNEEDGVTIELNRQAAMG